MSEFGFFDVNRAAKQAMKEKVDMAVSLAACLLRGIWILNGSSRVSTVKFEYWKFIPSPSAYHEFEQRVRLCVKGHLIDDGIWRDAMRDTESLSLQEIIALSSKFGFFDAMAPDLVLVSDVMQS